MRLINVDTLIAYIKKRLKNEMIIAWLCRIIGEVPTIEAEPVRYGSIIETIEDGRMKRVFSCCGTDFTKMTCWMMPNYCPNCGAKLHGGANDVSD